MYALNISLHEQVLKQSTTRYRYTKEWEATVTRLGRWIDFENDYKTSAFVDCVPCDSRREPRSESLVHGERMVGVQGTVREGSCLSWIQSALRSELGAGFVRYVISL
jgi:hypothetical protein